MSSATEINISKLIDDRPIGGFNIKILRGIFVLLFDGCDIGVLAFAAPDPIRAWNVTDRSSPGRSSAPASSASCLIDLFGYIGDRFGRRTAIISSCIAFGVTTLAAFCDLHARAILPAFADGFGLGGLFPRGGIAPNTHRKHRATLVIIGFNGVTFGVVIRSHPYISRAAFLLASFIRSAVWGPSGRRGVISIAEFQVSGNPSRALAGIGGPCSSAAS